MVTHPIAPEAWPTADQAARSLWFSPVKLGLHCVARTRSWVPAMVPWRATDEGDVTPDVLDWYGRFARGRPGVIVVEATGIRDVPSGPLLRISHDRFVTGLARIVDRVRTESAGETRVFLQLIDFLSIRRRPDPRKYFARFLRVGASHRESLSATTGDPSWLDAADDRVRTTLASLDEEILERVLTPRELDELFMGARERVTDTHELHLRNLPGELPDRFAEAARRAERAGFDGVELHYAHAYTMASFLSRLNTRTDGYGSTLEGRVRLPLEVFRRVRASVSERFVVGCRFLGDECIDGGSTLDDAVHFGVEFARAGMDFLSVSKGGKFEDARRPRVGEAAYPYTGPSGHECMPTVRSDARGPFGRNLPLARAIRAAVRQAGIATPVVAAGGINSFALAEQALARGDADVVASARQSIADPDWFLKVQLGLGESVRRCKFTNYCEALDQMHKQVTCQLWDRIRPDDADAASAPRSRDGRRRLVAPSWSPPPSDDGTP